MTSSLTHPSHHIHIHIHITHRSTSFQQQDFGDITFDLTADLRPLWNWNVKELFLYVTAEYATEQNEFNQVILWDQIIVRGEGGDNIDGPSL